MKTLSKAHLIRICIVLETCIILTLGVYIYQKRQASQVLGVASVAPLRKEYLIFPPDSPLKYYYEPKPNITEEEQPEWLSYKARYTINSDTFNERYDYPVAKPKDVYRILALGDSFTFGHFVNTRDNWTEQLEDMLNARQPCGSEIKYEVINLGERGYDVQYIAYRFKNRGKKYNPDLIIWHESGSGFDRIIELLYPLVGRNMEELTPQEKALVSEHPNADPALWKAVNELRQTHTKDELFEQIYASWLDFFETRGNKPVLIATFSTLTPKDLAKLKYWTGQQPEVSLYTGIPNIYDLEGGLPDGHPNVKGHTIIANSIYDSIVEEYILSCRN